MKCRGVEWRHIYTRIVEWRGMESEELWSLLEQVLECRRMRCRGMESGEGGCSRKRNGAGEGSGGV